MTSKLTYSDVFNSAVLIGVTNQKCTIEDIAVC